MDRAIIMHTQIKNRIIELASIDPAREICGYIYHNMNHALIYPCKNIAPNPTEEFEIGIDEQMAVEQISGGRLLGIYHSHPQASSFSSADLEYAEEIHLPQYLIAGGEWHEYIPPTYHIDLVGMDFILGFQDCFGLIRNYFRQKYGHYITDYDRDESMSHEKDNTIMNSFEKEGFVEVSQTDIQMDDVLLFKSNLALPQHFGIFQGNSTFLHHPRYMLSIPEQLTDRWMSRLKHVLRRKLPLV